MKVKLETIVSCETKFEDELFKFIIGDVERSYSPHRPFNVRIENSLQYKEHFKRFPIIFNFETGRIEINTTRIRQKSLFARLIQRKKFDLGYRVLTQAHGEENGVNEFIKLYDNLAGKIKYKMTVL